MLEEDDDQEWASPIPDPFTIEIEDDLLADGEILDDWNVGERRIA